LVDTFCGGETDRRTQAQGVIRLRRRGCAAARLCAGRRSRLEPWTSRTRRGRLARVAAGSLFHPGEPSIDRVSFSGRLRGVPLDGPLENSTVSPAFDRMDVRLARFFWRVRRRSVRYALHFQYLGAKSRFEIFSVTDFFTFRERKESRGKA
jgi:hypothetical protein